MVEQAKKLTLTSRAFRNDQLGLFYKELCELTNSHKVLPMNSGAEAVETVIKAVRKWGYQVKGVPEDRAEIVVCADNFHGRTITIVGFSSEEQYREGFGPFTPGFRLVPYGDIGAFRAALGERTAAVLVEPIQGEAGVVSATSGFLQSLRELCDEQGLLLILDEVQTGVGRTGKWFAYQHFDVEPDIMTMAKALGGGVAIGAMMAKSDIADSLVPGTHASTFGGNSLACAAAIAVIEAIEEENLLQNAAKLGAYTKEKLEQLKQKHPVIDHIRGIGLMIGVQLTGPGAKIVDKCLEKGLRINCTQETVLRLMPPMNVTRGQIDDAIEILDGVLGEVK